MITTALPPEEFWFYRVFSELTLSLLHKINNELTGVVFQVENLQELSQANAPISECAEDLGTSISHVLGLLRQSVALHREPEERPLGAVPLSSLLTTSLPVLRLVLPKSIHLVVPAPSSDPWIYLAEEDFVVLLAATALLLHPPGSHPSGEFHILPAFSRTGNATLHVSMSGAGFSTTALLQSQPAPWGSLLHRLQRLGCSAHPPQHAGEDYIALHFPTTPRQ